MGSLAFSMDAVVERCLQTRGINGCLSGTDAARRRGLAGVEPWEVPDWLVRLVDQAELREAARRAVWEAECERRRGSVRVNIDAWPLSMRLPKKN
jgi:hypothetical protein